MKNLDRTWQPITDEELIISYRKSPVQPDPENFIYYQYVSEKTHVVIEFKVPTITNIKKLERFALDYKVIKRRTELPKVIETDPDFARKLTFNDALKMLNGYVSYLTSPEGHICYTRESITTDPGYLKGMTVVAGIITEDVYLRHFDNVYSVAVDRGYKHFPNNLIERP